MMRCDNCGHKVKSDATFCTHCGNRVDIPNQNSEGSQSKPHTAKNYKKYAVLGAIAICFIGYFFGVRCKAGLCLLPSGFRGEYCIVHTCKMDGCSNKKATDKSYCYTHSPTTSSGVTYTPEAADDVLDFSSIEITHNSSYTVCTGTITNNGKRNYSFVKVKGKFKDSSGTVLDTDWTYAVGSEGLAPGESTTFRLSVDKNRNITKCAIELLDYDKE